MSQSAVNTLIDIDFLPQRYRDESAQRTTQFWRIVVAAVVGMVLLSAWAIQWSNQRYLAQELDIITPIHEAAHGRTVQLTTLKKELASAEAEADLLSFLSHPWPKTQIIAAIVEPMPESIKLSELTIGRMEEEATAVLPSQRARNGEKVSTGTTKSAEKLSAEQQDLVDLRAEFDKRGTVVLMTGEISDVSELHQYLGDIAQHRLILKAELRSIESSGAEDGKTVFRARITIRPGYGIPGGPTGEPVETKAATVSSARSPQGSANALARRDQP